MIEDANRSYRYFSDRHGKVLTVAHNSTMPGIDQDRAIYLSVSIPGSSTINSLAISVSDTEELIGALLELVNQAAPKQLYVVDTTLGAYQSWARSEEQALQYAREWAAASPAAGRVGNRVWKVDMNG